MAQDKIVSAEFQKVGSIIRANREMQKLSLRELGKKMGCSATHIFRIERGVRKASPELLYKICKALDLPAKQIIGEVYPCINELGNAKNDIKSEFPKIKSEEEAKLIESIVSELINAKFTQEEYKLVKDMIKAIAINRTIK